MLAIPMASSTAELLHCTSPMKMKVSCAIRKSSEEGRRGERVGPKNKGWESRLSPFEYLYVSLMVNLFSF